MIKAIEYVLDLSATIYIIILIVRWVIEMFLTQYQNTGWFLKLRDLTEPLLAFIRKIVPSFQGIDFSYIIAIIGVKAVAKLLIWII
jgi:uncharacterized protein YggT (Ycf19 family)